MFVHNFFVIYSIIPILVKTGVISQCTLLHFHFLFSYKLFLELKKQKIKI